MSNAELGDGNGGYLYVNGRYFPRFLYAFNDSLVQLTAFAASLNDIRIEPWT